MTNQVQRKVFTPDPKMLQRQMAQHLQTMSAYLTLTRAGQTSVRQKMAKDRTSLRPSKRQRPSSLSPLPNKSCFQSQRQSDRWPGSRLPKIKVNSKSARIPTLPQLTRSVNIPSASSSTTSLAQGSRPRLVAKSTSGLSNSAKNAKSSGRNGAIPDPMQVWNKNRGNGFS